MGHFFSSQPVDTAVVDTVALAMPLSFLIKLMQRKALMTIYLALLSNV